MWQSLVVRTVFIYRAPKHKPHPPPHPHLKKRHAVASFIHKRITVIRNVPQFHTRPFDASNFQGGSYPMQPSDCIFLFSDNTYISKLSVSNFHNHNETRQVSSYTFTLSTITTMSVKTPHTSCKPPANDSILITNSSTTHYLNGFIDPALSHADNIPSIQLIWWPRDSTLRNITKWWMCWLHVLKPSVMSQTARFSLCRTNHFNCFLIFLSSISALYSKERLEAHN